MLVREQLCSEHKRKERSCLRKAMALHTICAISTYIVDDQKTAMVTKNLSEQR